MRPPSQSSQLLWQVSPGYSAPQATSPVCVKWWRLCLSIFLSVVASLLAKRRKTLRQLVKQYWMWSSKVLICWPAPAFVVTQLSRERLRSVFVCLYLHTHKREWKDRENTHRGSFLAPFPSCLARWCVLSVTVACPTGHTRTVSAPPPACVHRA